MARDIAAERREIDAAVEGQTVCSMFRDTVAQHGDVPALRWKRDDAWQTLTWADYGRLAEEFGLGLVSLGLERGEFVNLLSANRPEYYVSDVGILHGAGVPVSLYNTLAPEQIEYIVNHCEAVFVIVEDRAYLERILKVRASIPNVRKVIMFTGAEEFEDDDWIVSYDSVLEAGRELAGRDASALRERWSAVTPDDLCTLIYTSGTTGPPKGVMVTHYNVCWTAESLDRLMPREPGMRHISYLPLAHIAERMAGHYLHIKGASTAYFCPNPAEIGAYLKEVRPEFLFAVPRIWEKLYYGLSAAIDNNPDDGQRRAGRQAIEALLERVRIEQAGREVPADVAERAEGAEPVAAFIRSMVGLDAVRIASSGAAPIAPEILEWFHAIGVPVAEVYGQSEDTGPTSWNRPGDVKIGTVGPTIPGVEVKLADDGELLVRGGNLTRGYYKEPVLTAETFDEDGWLHSGDVAEIDDDGFIRIVDRKKEILITAGGKNIAPSNIENLLKQQPLVGQACVVGDRRPYVTALIVLDSETAQQWAAARGLPAELATLAGHPDVRAEVEGYIAEINTKLHNQEQVKRFTILPREWTVDSEELTPTLKMKRKVVNQKYADEIEAMYA